MPNYRIDVEYEGTRYRGWQEQPNVRTVAGELRRAIGRSGYEILELGGSGRTDAGVHALRQTAGLRLRRRADPRALAQAINNALPADIHVLRVLEARAVFHARHDAISRSYIYQVSLRRTGLAKRHVWWFRQPLDTALLERAAARVEGRHDFARFCERPTEQGSTIVVVERSTVITDGDLVVLRMVASHFLWKMVRRVVGTLVQVASGGIELAELDDLLTERQVCGERAGPAQWTAPASGLFLERVLYPGEAPLGPPSSVSRIARIVDEERTAFVGPAQSHLPGRRTTRPRQPRSGRPRR